MTITRDENGNLLPQYCNLRLTRRLPDDSMETKSRYSMSVIEAAQDDFYDNMGVMDIHSVEWRGAHIGQDWHNVTTAYLAAAHELANGRD